MSTPAPEGVQLPPIVDSRFVSLDDVLAASPSGTAGRHPLPTPSEFAASLAELGIGHLTTVVAYDDRGGALAGRLVWMLRILGERAALLDGGITAWEAAGETIDAEPVTWECTERAVIDWPLDALADAIDVERHNAAGGVGEQQVDRFLPAHELHARFAPVVGDDERPIVYCGSGVTACHNALAMERAGFATPRVYVGSWSGWTADPDRSIATGPTP